MSWAPVLARPPSPITAPLQTTPIGIGIMYRGWSVGAPEGVGEESGINLPSAKTFFIAAMKTLLAPYFSILSFMIL